MITHVNSYTDLSGRIESESRSFLLIYKKGADQSERAFSNIENILEKHDDIRVFAADVNQVRDIHPVYHITTAPTLIEFENKRVRNSIKGAHDQDFYGSLFEKALFMAAAEKEGKEVKQVTVYTTPTCSWCTTLKSYLRNNRVYFTEIDVSKNESAAREMQQKSGQQGVPQTMINGEMVVGFDKTKINRLLGINGS